MKKGLIVIGSLGLLYLFFAYALPYLISIPLAYHNSYVASSGLSESKKTFIKPVDSIRRFPFPIGSVSDYESIFTEEQIKTLSKKVIIYEKETTREIAIVSLKSIEPYEDISKFATDLSNEWGIGKPEKNNGLLILFSKYLREIRISTGKGTEKILTDKTCKKIIKTIIIPEFRKENYYIGIEKGLDSLIENWK